MQTARNKELKTIIKESVKEVLEEELVKLRLMFFSDASDREMEDIAGRYGKPEKKSVHVEKVDI